MNEKLYYKTPYNSLKIEIKDGKLITMKKTNQDIKENILPESEIGKKIFIQLDEYFQGKRITFDIPCELIGTNFQKTVWQKLLEIPYGQLRSYKDIAISIKKENGFRAVGNAIGKNPIWIIIPCHRVVGSNGSLTGYAGGIDMKKGLLMLEKDNKNKYNN